MTSRPWLTETWKVSSSTRELNRVLRVSMTRPLRMGVARLSMISAAMARIDGGEQQGDREPSPHTATAPASTCRVRILDHWRLGCAGVLFGEHCVPGDWM